MQGMGPDQEADQGDTQARQRHPAIAKQRLAGEHRQQFTDDAQARQHEDVDDRVRIEPEEMLVEDGVAAARRVEEVQTITCAGR